MYKKVLIPVDVSDVKDATALLGAAKALTQTWDAALHVVTVVPSVGMPIVGSYFDEKFETEGRAAVAQQLAEILSDVGLAATQHVLSGSIYANVLELAGDIDADLIVIGAHQPDLRDYLLGTNAARVVRHSQQSVLVVRHPQDM